MPGSLGAGWAYGDHAPCSEASLTTQERA